MKRGITRLKSFGYHARSLQPEHTSGLLDQNFLDIIVKVQFHPGLAFLPTSFH